MKSGCYRVIADESTNDMEYYFPAQVLRRVVQEYLVGTRVIVNLNGTIKRGEIRTEKKDSHYTILFKDDGEKEIEENFIVRKDDETTEEKEKKEKRRKTKR